MHKELYMELLALLEKAEPPDSDGSDYTELLRDAEPRLTTTLLSMLKSARAKFLRRFKQLPDETELSAFIQQQVQASFAGLSGPVLDQLSAIAKDAIKVGIEQYDLQTDYDTANAAALDVLQGRVDNLFVTVTQDTVDAIHQAIAQAKTAQHDLQDVAQAVRDTYGKDIVTSDGRTLDNLTWATMVARTEGTRAAAEGTRAALTSSGYQTWRWIVESAGCDDCQSNDDAVVAIGDAFPSGDDAPPLHPNCRCVVMPNLTELTGDDDEQDESSEETPMDT